MFTLTEDPEKSVQAGAWVGDWHGFVVQLTDENASPVDITTGTLGVTYTDIATGSAYSFGGGTATLTKSFSTQGIVTVLNPAAYPTATTIRVTVSFTVGTVVRRYGPLEIKVLAP